MTANTITVRGEQYRVLSQRRITGTGPRFDGRLRFELERVTDGARYAWLGSRSTGRVPSNAALSAVAGSTTPALEVN